MSSSLAINIIFLNEAFCGAIRAERLFANKEEEEEGEEKEGENEVAS